MFEILRDPPNEESFDKHFDDRKSCRQQLLKPFVRHFEICSGKFKCIADASENGGKDYDGDGYDDGNIHWHEQV